MLPSSIQDMALQKSISSLAQMRENNCNLYSDAKNVTTSVQMENFNKQLFKEKNISQQLLDKYTDYHVDSVWYSVGNNSFIVKALNLQNHFSMSWLSPVHNCSANILA